MTTIKWLIATDLDGTLLDDSYPYQEAARAIDEIQKRYDSRVALASSKTLAEMLELAQRATVPPFLIFENGGGIAWPTGFLRQPGESRLNGYEVTLLGGDLGKIYRALECLQNHQRFKYQTFSQLSDQQICDITLLPMSGVQLARERFTCEPILWQDSEEQLASFKSLIKKADLNVVEGQRFLHIGHGVDKAHALQYLRRKISYERGEHPRLLACGDAPNDLEMINSADLALLFPGRDGRYLHDTDTKHAHAPMAGPSHWLQGVQRIFATV